MLRPTAIGAEALFEMFDSCDCGDCCGGFSELNAEKAALRLGAFLGFYLAPCHRAGAALEGISNERHRGARKKDCSRSSEC